MTAALNRRTQACERQRRSRVAKAAALPLVYDPLAEPPIVNTVQPHATAMAKSFKRKRHRAAKSAEAIINEFIESLGAERQLRSLKTNLRSPAMTKLLATAGFVSLEDTALDSGTVNKIYDTAVDLKDGKTHDAQCALGRIVTLVQSGMTPVQISLHG